VCECVLLGFCTEAAGGAQRVEIDGAGALTFACPARVVENRSDANVDTDGRSVP
jgi:hypothetical protein